MFGQSRLVYGKSGILHIILVKFVAKKTDEELEAQENIFSLELLGICNELLWQLGSPDCMAAANLEAFIGL